MIFDKLSNIIQYKGISKNLDLAIETILTGDFKNKEIGKYEILDKEVFYMIQDYTTKEHHDCSFETHDAYTDIQIVISGKEGMGFASYDNLNISVPFNLEKDVEKQSGSSDFILNVEENHFAVFFPKEPHMPCMCIDSPSNVKKAVFKIKL